MRTYAAVVIILVLSMLIFPVFAVTGQTGDRSSKENAYTSEVENGAARFMEDKYISVLSTATGKIEKMDMREYLIGSVAAEMPAVYHTQALKAQAVASYTYAKRVEEQNLKHKDPSLGEADISDNTKTHQGYIDKAGRREKWGKSFDEYEKKISTAVDDVLGCYIEYNGETALAVYHSISAGRTQSAKNIWGSDILYLTSVESPGDRLSPDFISEVYFDEDEFEQKAEECGVKVRGKAKNWIDGIETDENGYTKTVEICSREISAAKFREIFGIRGMSFDIDYVSGGFNITSRGHGHGVGMSQYGADYMARQGSTWQEILSHYYPGTNITTEKTF